MRIPRNRKTISPLKHFFSAESRDGLIAFFASPLRPPLSLLLHSLLHPNFRCTRLQFFATSWPALRAESTSGSVFSSLNRGVYIYICAWVRVGVSTKREKKRTRRKWKKKKKTEKKGSTLESFYLRLLSSLFCARQDETFRSITNETVFMSRCRSFEIAPSMLGSEPFLPDNVPPGSFQIML